MIKAPSMLRNNGEKGSSYHLVKLTAGKAVNSTISNDLVELIPSFHSLFPRV